ncbi:Hypothetical protein PHPALM_12398 [Phytophthora palmivora]|uniref:MULE transposase domain-containing protein n=1 Tax=Phytophthora palmivora TaxID=4796 RepID=A0A2P4XZU5_9STRA|nr:Hypothetical protein PHPALM_12398 [Phytophthora palmivora]
MGITFEKFYLHTDEAVRASHYTGGKRVFGGKRVDMPAQVEAPNSCKLKGSQLGFLQFNYTWHGDKKAKPKSSDPKNGSGIEKVIGWAHPELRDLLLYAGLNVVLDSTFRCTSNQFIQRVTFMMSDPRTKLYLPVFFSLMTSRTQDSYKHVLHCIEFAVGSKPDINTLVCDFESVLSFAVVSTLQNLEKWDTYFI